MKLSLLVLFLVGCSARPQVGECYIQSYTMWKIIRVGQSSVFMKNIAGEVRIQLTKSLFENAQRADCFDLFGDEK